MDWRDLAQAHSRLPIRIGARRCPQLPGRASNKPGIAVEQISQRPSSVSRQVVMSYEVRLKRGDDYPLEGTGKQHG
jgi:hypothetical protein